jgi:AraC-like DNA-binding protein
MSLVFRADEEPAASRVERLRHAVGDTVAPIDVRPSLADDEIADRILMKEIGSLRVVAATLSPGSALRTPRLIRRSDPELCKIDLVVRGRLVVEQGGREAALGPGDFAFVDLSKPCGWSNSSMSQGVAVMFPRSMLRLPPGDVARLTALRIPGDEGTGALLSTLVRQLPEHVEHRIADGARLGGAVLDLLSVAMAARLGEDARRVPPEPRQRALLTDVYAFIERRLGDPELTPATVAAAHHISVRYLYKLFESEGTTVAEWIRRRRLESCRRDLLDPSLAHRPVGAIAARWGLPNAAHFSRLFRDAYDVPPGRYRLERSGPAA